ncbi:MAG: hybrid sensor histidine kinase/response regulator [Acidobacteriota bacterium]
MPPVEACRVLLADDDRNLCRTLCDILEVKGHPADVANSAGATLEACAARDYDVLLLDISLPDLSGLDLIAKLEESQPGMDILIITGNASLDNAVQSVSRSTIGYLVKPIDLDRLLAILDGISRRKQVALENQRLVESREALIRQLEEKNAELERYSYTVSHDLTSPLVTITGFLGMIEQSAAAGDIDQVRVDIARITETTLRMKQLLDELLELSRIGRVVNPPRDVELAGLVRQAVDSLAGPIDQKGVAVEIAEGLPTVHGDGLRLLQVVQNLVDNAIKFMGDQPQPRIEIGARLQGPDETLPGETLRSETASDETGTDETGSDKTGSVKTDKTGSVETDKTGSVETDKTGSVKTDKTGSVKTDKTGSVKTDKTGPACSWVVWVKDNGIGIEPERSRDVFGLFQQVEKSTGGSGIGLALVKRIVDFHGGRTWVESPGPGQGSSFYFTLPAGGLGGGGAA